MQEITTLGEKSGGSLDPAGLRSSIVKALFHDLSLSKSPTSDVEASDNVFIELTKASPLKKTADLSLSEGDLTLTEELKTPVVRTNSQNLFVSAASEKNHATELRSIKERATKVSKRPKEVTEGSDSNSGSRGPTLEHLAWLKACRKGDLTTCKKLLDVNPNLLHYKPPLHLNFSGVHIATLGKHYDLLRLLKNKGANFNSKTRCGYTPLHLAAQNQDREMVQILIEEFGVDTTIHDLLGYTYQYYADWLCYPKFDEIYHPLVYCGSNSSRNSSRQASIGSQESLTSSKNSLSRSGSLREAIKEFLHIPTKGVLSRTPSATQL
ncbi:hypothetical protein KIN20_033252 [Parelaphostrongylus tenuis]|uniref:Uncharacterized protein n=1 Tax=Parelaphostrongylus tenuis TaxID=148309 RepID=A0AAD5WIM3_PARTN|nr:hypothetical protein KIN20_033252 [Parelaphostrongylus tenuis]